MKQSKLLPLSDGEAPFHLEPADVAAEIEMNALRHIADGQAGLLGRLIPALEREAIARFARQGGYSADPVRRPASVPEDRWVESWQSLASRQVRDCDDQPESVVWASAQVILRARDLREAIAAGDAEKAAALAMLLGAWVFVGGIGVKYAAAADVADRHMESQRQKARKPRTTIEGDAGRFTKRTVVEQAWKAAGGGAAGTPQVWPHLFSELDRAGLSPDEGGAKSERWIRAGDAMFTFKGVQKMLGELRQGAKGRPKKKPP